MSPLRLVALSALSLSTLLSACSPPVACTEEARPSVQVTVVNVDGVSVANAEVSFSVDGAAFEDCAAVMTGQWSCGTEVAGDITIRASGVGYQTHEETITVSADECHVVTEDLQIALEEEIMAGAWEEPRAYFVRLFADDDECEDSWEQHGMNCYQTAWFCPDGHAEFIVTDIVNSAVYAVSGSEVAVSLTGPGDMPSEFVFEIDADGSLIDEYEVRWERDVVGDIVGMPLCTLNAFE